MKGRILFVISSHEKLGDTGKKTGYYLSEVAHPWKVLTEAGYEIDFVSPKGGKCPVDGFDLEDSVNREFWENNAIKTRIDKSMKPFEVDPEEYVAIHYAGGHGTVWDFPENEAIAELGAKIYEKGGVVTAVCHGPSGLLNLKLSDGSYLVDGKKVNAFTNEEEKAMELDNVVPYLLEDELKKRGADFQKADMWAEFTVTDGRLITGQNPQSGTKIGKELVTVLENLKVTA